MLKQYHMANKLTKNNKKNFIYVSVGNCAIKKYIDKLYMRLLFLNLFMEL